MNVTDQANLYRFMIESSRDVIFLLDRQGRFVFINKRIESLLGYSRQGLIGKHYSEIVHPDDLAQAKLNYHENSSPTVKQLSRSIELRLRHQLDRRDFRYFHIKVLNVPEEISRTYAELVPATGQQGADRRITSYVVASDISHLKIFDNIINTNANYDYLTGLPNRILLRDRINMTIAQAKREERKFAVMFIDLDGFKQVNDFFGHSEGDVLLQAEAVRLKTCLREADTLARVGGDEFMLLLPDIHERHEVQQVANKLLHELKRPFNICGHNLSLSASIGVALYPDNGKLFDDLIKSADRAMYHIKHRSKNGYAFYSELSDNHKQGNTFIMI